MSDISYHRKHGQPFRLPAKERARLERLSESEIVANAEADPDNPPLDDIQLERMALARTVRMIRERTGLSQREFAARFHIGLGRLRDFEQARSEPDTLVRVFYRLILEDPARAASLADRVEREGLSLAH